MKEHEFALYSLINVCKELVRYMKKSGDVRKLNKTLTQECDTRWCSTINMLISVNENLSEIRTLYKNTRHESSVDSIDTELLDNVIEFLKGFKTATLKFETEKNPMFGYVSFVIKNLKDHIMRFTENEIYKELNEIARKAHNSVCDLFETNILHSAASFLYPQFNRLTWLQKEQTKRRIKICERFRG